MLKIKDDIDLKELEKFGFKERKKFRFTKEKVVYSKNNDWTTGKITIAGGNRHIRIIACGSPNDIDEIFNLIQAGLVEKVKELKLC